MSDLSKWSNSAGGNTSPSPDGWPENMAPSGVNDSARENMAATRRWYETAEWIDLGYTPTYATTANFTLAGDRSAIFHAGRRIRATDTSTIYGTIASASYSTLTRVSVTWDSGGLTASLTAVAVGILSVNNDAIPSSSVRYQTFGAGIGVSGTSTFTNKVVFNDGVFVGGAVEISATVSCASRVAFNDGIDVSGTAAFNGTFTGSAILDEDDLTSNSATKLATQQSIKAYVDNTYAAGTYSPSLTIDTGVTSATAQQSMYAKIGNIVHVSGTVTDVRHTTPGTLGSFFLSLPIASTLGSSNDLAGVGTIFRATSFESVYIYGSIGTNLANLQYLNSTSSTYIIKYTYSYKVI